MEVPEITTFESHLIRVRLNEKIANPLYYYYYFSSPICNMKSIVTQCAQAGIKGSDLSKLEVILPSLEIQNRIFVMLFVYTDVLRAE